MAASLKRMPVMCLRHAACCLRPAVTHSRSCSSKRTDDDSPPPWAPRQVPLGNTFKAIYLTKSQNKAYWVGLHEKLNKHWKKELTEMKRRMEEKVDQAKPEAPLLLMVMRVRNLSGRPYWEKEWIRELGLYEEMFAPKVFPNKESFTNRLKRVKHLIEVLPVWFPYGLPETEEDYEHCVLKDNGEFVVIKKLEAKPEESALVTKEDPTSVWDIKQETIDRTLELKKMRYDLNAEYFSTEYIWKRNEDGKEYRYKGNFNVGSEKKWY